MKTIKVGVVGATGYAGSEICRLIAGHPQAELAAISSVSFEGMALSQVYPAYNQMIDLVCGTQDQVVEQSDVVFAALPHGLSQDLAAQCDALGKTFIDMGGTLRYNYENALSAQSLGAEVEIRKSLDFIGMRNFSLLFNATLIKSNVRFDESGIVKTEDRPMQGQSPYIINAGLYYQNEKWGLMSSLLYNRLGKRIIGIGKSNSTTHDVSVNIPDTYEMPRNSLDFTISKKLGKLIELKAGVKDILAEKVVYKQFPQFYDAAGQLQEREQVTKSYRPGRAVSVGITFNF